MSEENPSVRHTMSVLTWLGPENYDHLFAYRTQEDLPFFLRRCREAAAWGSGRVLEVACGTGRLTIPIAGERIEIAGLDVLPEMLATARAKAEAGGVTISWHEADCRDFDLGERFSLIFIPFNSMLHLHTNEDVLRFLGCARRHLEPEGRFLLDVFVPSVNLLARDPDREVPVFEYRDAQDPPDGPLLKVSEFPSWDAATQQLRNRWIFRREGEIVAEERLTLRCFFPLEIEALLRLGGFRVTRRWGDFRDAPFGAASGLQLVESVPLEGGAG